MHIPKWLIATAALIFVMLVAAIAFFIGRDSARLPAVEVRDTPVQQEPQAVDDPAPKDATPPLAESGGDTAAVVTPPLSGGSTAVADISPAAAGARARVAAYFTEMNAIQSGGPVGGNAEEFASTILNAAISGNFSGIDDLIRAAGDAERRAGALQPPAECADYHRQAITLLQESKALAITLRDGLKRNDVNALTSVGDSAQAMKSRADNLATAEKTLRARFGL